MFQKKLVEKIKTDILCSRTLSLKSCRYSDNVKKYGTARQATDDIIKRMRFAYWITKTIRTHTHKHAENIHDLMIFHGNNGFTSAPQCYVIVHCPSYYLYYYC